MDGPALNIAVSGNELRDKSHAMFTTAFFATETASGRGCLIHTRHVFARPKAGLTEG